MSFSTDVKTELVNYWPKAYCCKAAEAYGLLLYNRFVGDKKIIMQTEFEETAFRLKSLLRHITGIDPTVINENKIYSVYIENDEDRKILTKTFEVNNFDKSFFKCDNCKHAFLRGAFLSCGTVADPKKAYDLEFITGSENTGWELCLLLKEFSLDPKLIERNGIPVVYLKESENIEDLLTIMEATNSALEIMNIKIYKNFRNKANRIANCETANIQKTVDAAAEQLAAIKILESKGLLKNLPPELYEVAVARRDNNDIPLSELAAMLSISRSGVYHRLQKIINIAKEIKK